MGIGWIGHIDLGLWTSARSGCRIEVVEASWLWRLLRPRERGLLGSVQLWLFRTIQLRVLRAGELRVLGSREFWLFGAHQLWLFGTGELRLCR